MCLYLIIPLQFELFSTNLFSFSFFFRLSLALTPSPLTAVTEQKNSVYPSSFCIHSGRPGTDQMDSSG